MCFLSFICSALYVGFLISWFGDRISIKKFNLKYLYEAKWLPLTILIILAILSQLVGFLFFNVFITNNYFFNLQEINLF
jgi:hypothetical protein